ncbi:hypothetical protein KKH30_04400 [Candidatus Micrarchaeota archaeon]|nr:hypothetical protein [Candidatus Micrarchaeota archaeon]
MREIVKNPRIILLVALLLMSFLLIGMKGLDLGVDFKGGTMFQIHLSEPVDDASQMNTIKSIIQQRMDSYGLKDTKVTPWGNEFIIAQIAETDPDAIAELETLLRTQGKFEATLDGEVLFEGSDIIQIVKDPGRGYGFREENDSIRWDLPFVLKQEAARKFSHAVFHRCTATGYAEAGAQYDCDSTYFFIDRPVNSIIVISSAQYAEDSQALLLGNRSEDITPGTEIEELFLNAALPYFIVDENFSAENLVELSVLPGNYKQAIILPSLPQEMKEQLIAQGLLLKEILPESAGSVAFDSAGNPVNSFGTSTPWVWQVTGAQQTIALSPGITGWEPYVATVEEQKIFADLFITGSAENMDAAQSHLQNLTILLETGSLPVPIDNISKETISPLLGQEFLQSVFLIGIVALVVVSLAIFVRYRKIKLTIPIAATGLSEVIIILGFASLIDWNLDLAAVAGIIAAVGTGVDDQIIITDELMRGEEATAGSLLNRVKRAFFIIMAAAATTIATMLPIIIFGFGFGKLVGFAVTTIAGVLIGVFITRPAYGEMAKAVLSKY